MIRVAVIGAGVAGISATQCLSKRMDKFQFVTYECAKKIGGIWRYTDKVRKDFSEYEHVSACGWNSLRTNSPTIFTEFPGFYKWETESSFKHRKEVEKYIDNFAAEYKLLEYIQTRTAVQKVHPVLNEDGSLQNWEVTVKRLETGEIEVGHFDAVMDCRGRFGKPRMPEIPGLPTFTGKYIHSDDFRHEEDFRGKRVVVLGISWSSFDIVYQQLRGVAKEIVWAMKPRGMYTLYMDSAQTVINSSNSITQKPEIKQIDGPNVIFEDNTSCEADALIVCTGYTIERPYLTPECKIEIDGGRVDPLYKFIFNAHYPSLIFIGISYNLMPFVSDVYQADCALNILEGKKSLPDKETMLKDIQREYEEQLQANFGDKNHTMGIGPNAEQYHLELAEVGGTEPLNKAVVDGFTYFLDTVVKDYTNVRDYSYKALSDTEVLIEEPKK